MSFVNEPDFQDDFRKVGEDATSAFEAPGAFSNSTDHASSENLDIAAKADDPEVEDPEDDDLEEDEEDEDEEGDEDVDDLDEDEDEDDEDENEDDLEDDEDEEDDEEEEDDAVPVKARLNNVEVSLNAA